MKIGIIGAGISGLVSARYCLEEGHEILIFEQTGTYGGCWNYTDEIGIDKNGLPLHSAMYKNLRTNLPKEIMVFEDFPHTSVMQSYVPQEYILDYVKRYTKNFNIEQHIIYHTQVMSINPRNTDEWVVDTIDSRSKMPTSYLVDAIMVCNGHFYRSRIPEIQGQEQFSGNKIHSQDFRTPDQFKEKIVLIVGAGPSGVDIAKHVATSAKIVHVSSKPIVASNLAWAIPTALNIFKKPEIKYFDEFGAHFIDGTYAEVDTIIYCTGYSYVFPFLPKETGIEVDDNWVKYVYRHLINIEHPTMAIVGLPYGTSLFPYVDLMARYFLAHLAKRFALPSKREMMKYALEEQKHRIALGWPQRYAHKTYDVGEKLAYELAREANIKPIPEVLFKIQKYISKSRLENDCFKVVDDEHFIKLC